MSSRMTTLEDARQGDVQQPLPASGAVHDGRLVQRRLDVQQRRQEDDRGVASLLPDELRGHQAFEQPGSVMTLMAGRPRSRRVWTKMPEPPSTCCHSETTMTHEMKWGR